MTHFRHCETISRSCLKFLQRIGLGSKRATSGLVLKPAEISSPLGLTITPEDTVLTWCCPKR